MAQKPNRLLKHLQELYGTEAGARAHGRLLALMDLYRPSVPSRAATARTLTRRDVLLITYADQVRASGVKPLATLDAFARRFFTDCVSGIHILPFYPWSSDDGFSVKDYKAVEQEYGAWEDVEGMSEVFDLMFDAVFNHMSAQSEWFRRFLDGDPEFGGFFQVVEGDPDLSMVVRPRALPLLTEFESRGGRIKVWTTFSGDQVDLNVREPAVLLALLDVLLFYVSKGATFVRLDAIAFLWKELGTSCLHLPQTHRVIQLMRAVLENVAPGVRLITETNVPHADNVSYFGDGTNEAQLVYNFALPPLVLHSVASGDAAKLSEWARKLSLPSEEVTFFNFLASHDGIGLNPARGILEEREIESLVARTLKHGGFIGWKNLPDGTRAPYEMNINYFDALSDPAGGEAVETQVARFVCAHAVMLAMPGVPGIYFHSLVGSRGDRAAAESSGIPRRINRAKVEREVLERELGEEGSLRSRVFTRLRGLLKARRSCPAFDPGSGFRIGDFGSRVFGIYRGSSGRGQEVLALQNVSAEEVELELKEERVWRELEIGNGPAGRGGDGKGWRLEPYGVRWLVRG